MALPYPCHAPILRHFPFSLRIQLARRVRELRLAERKAPYKFDEIVVEHFPKGCRIELKSFHGSASVEIRETETGDGSRVCMSFKKELNFCTPMSARDTERHMLDFFLKRPGTVTKFMRVTGPGSEIVLGYPIQVTRQLHCEHVGDKFDFTSSSTMPPPVLCLDLELRADKVHWLLEKFQNSPPRINTRVEITVLESVFGGLLPSLARTQPDARTAIQSGRKPCVMFPLNHVDILLSCRPLRRQSWPWRASCKSGITSYQLTVVAKGTTSVVEVGDDVWTMALLTSLFV